MTEFQIPETVLILDYIAPANAFRAGADDYSFNGFNASAQVYGFRPFSGDIVQAFQMTLLRDWIAPMHREENVGAPPSFQQIAIPGAEFAVAANFVENIVGLPKPHMRLLIVARGAAAIFDASAGTAQSWQQAVPYVNAMAGTLRVEAAAAPPRLTRSDGLAVAGLYVGMKSKYMATMVNIIGSGYWTPALHYYLFSADGRVYRAYDRLDVPGGAIAAFDFDRAERADPVSSGRYTVAGDKLLIQMEGNQPETIVADVPQGGSLTINSTVYNRQ